MHITEDPSISMIIGNSAQIMDLKAAILKVAPRNTTVLITGDTGTGKELFAQAIHQGSFRRYKPFIRVNCAALPEALLESELFGYAEGTFTGGKRGGYLGKFAQADGGTVFLDEVAELPLALQAKLLRFLQEHEIQRLGESQPRQVNVRIVAATNANLAQLVKYNKFRADLFYRLNVVALEIPPLRDRREDILPLCQTFISSLNDEFSYRIYRLSPDVLWIFGAYPWPGNVRELGNVLEAAFNLCDGQPVLSLKNLPQYLRQWYYEHQTMQKDGVATVRAAGHGGTHSNTRQDSARNKLGTAIDLPVTKAEKNVTVPENFHNWTNYLNCLGRYSLAEIVDKLEADVIKHLLGQEENKSRVASLLGISRPALYKKIDKYSLRQL